MSHRVHGATQTVFHRVFYTVGVGILVSCTVVLVTIIPWFWLKEVEEQRQTIDMMNRKLDASNRRTASLELQLKTVLANTNVLIDVMRKLANENSVICQMPSGSDDDPTDSTPQGIPEEFQLEDSYLRKTLRESRNSGNFAVNLTRRLFPELFGEGQLRFEYNWYGGGKHTKKELDPVRK